MLELVAAIVERNISKVVSKHCLEKKVSKGHKTNFSLVTMPKNIVNDFFIILIQNLSRYIHGYKLALLKKVFFGLVFKGLKTNEKSDITRLNLEAAINENVSWTVIQKASRSRHRRIF